MSFPETIIERTHIFSCLKDPAEILQEVFRIRLSIGEAAIEVFRILNERFNLRCPPGIALKGTFNEQFFSISTSLKKRQGFESSQVAFFIRIDLLQPLKRSTEPTITCENPLFLDHPDIPSLDALQDQYLAVCELNSIKAMMLSNESEN
ncbi:hypothetical protein Lepto7375DRAFT_0246 [Leptolyngbya sp. PCC 7375]|nr:hypothetical protein Lepto7375DRAFT_0246 [Leptolyngbya sp. PCC 7375]